MLFKIEMPFNYRLEPFRRILKILDHSELDITIPDNIRIGLIFLLTLFSTLLVLETWLIKIDLFTHDDSLYRK